MQAPASKIDYLIVGQGLAGSLLAWHLLQQKQTVRIIARKDASSASRVAAGLINPVSGRRLVLQEGISELLPAAQRFYSDMQARFGRQFFFEKPLLRLIRHPRLREVYEQRRQQPEYAPFLGDWVEQGQGGWWQNRTGWLDTNALLDALHNDFNVQGLCIDQVFEHTELELLAHDVRWRQFTASTVIFCEGYLVRQNPWFDWLPMQPVKGEILTCETHATLADHILNAGQWIVPLSEHRFRLGANYERDHLNEIPTPSVAESLLANLASLLPEVRPAKVVAHKAGVRPGTVDKNPILGLHPAYPQLGIFNGFGSKGSLLIPWHAAHFAEMLANRSPLPPHADISRFVPRYYG